MTEMFLPTNPRYFDNHRVMDLLDAYDGPKIYTFYTTSNDFYFAYYVDDNGIYEEWIFTPTSESTINRLIKNEISIRSFFELSDVCYLTKLNKGQATSVQKVYFANLDADYIPENDVFLDYATTLFNIKLIKENISPKNTSESVVGNLVSHVRKLFKETMRTLRDEDPALQGFQATPDFYYNGILAGSVNIVLKPIRPNPLLEKAADIIQKVASGESAGVPKKVLERVERFLIPLSPNSNSKMYGFDSIEFSGIVPDGTNSKKFSFSLTSKTRAELQQKYGATSMTKSVTLTGILDQGIASAEEFVLSKLESNDLQLTFVKCQFDSRDIEIEGDIDEVAVWAFMKVCSLGKKLRVSGDFDMKDKILAVQSVQVEG